MNNFNQSGPGGLRGRQEYFGGRPASDAEYGKKKKFDKKSNFSKKGGDRGSSRGGFTGSKGGFGGGRGGERREVTMHKAVCSNCSKSCEVPFRPDGSKPVLCSECFGKNKSDDRNGVERRSRPSFDRPKRDYDSSRQEPSHQADFGQLQEQLASLAQKVEQIFELLNAAGSVVKTKKSSSATEEKKPVAKKAATKKVAPAKKKPAVKKAAPKKVVKKVIKKK